MQHQRELERTISFTLRPCIFKNLNFALLQMDMKRLHLLSWKVETTIKSEAGSQCLRVPGGMPLSLPVTCNGLNAIVVGDKLGVSLNRKSLGVCLRYTGPLERICEEQ